MQPTARPRTSSSSCAAANCKWPEPVIDVMQNLGAGARGTQPGARTQEAEVMTQHGTGKGGGLTGNGRGDQSQATWTM